MFELEKSRLAVHHVVSYKLYINNNTNKIISRQIAVGNRSLSELGVSSAEFGIRILGPS